MAMRLYASFLIRTSGIVCWIYNGSIVLLLDSTIILRLKDIPDHDDFVLR